MHNFLWSCMTATQFILKYQTLKSMDAISLQWQEKEALEALAVLFSFLIAMLS